MLQKFHKEKSDRIISIVGLGYVGLPVAVAFGKIGPVIGFDISERRIIELRNSIDTTCEVKVKELQNANIHFTNSPGDLRKANLHIIAVPTPINEVKQPDLTPLLGATKTVGRILKDGDIVVYESTVYPGCTEEECVPILERESGLKFNINFGVGYSPERINPGDKDHTFTKIQKIVSGSNPEISGILANAYASVVTAGIYEASSIKVAEAAKVIENTQRDLNIAFVNELALIFDKLGIDTQEVLEAAETKWNFHHFRPGLVGGHCIGVDPYYLTYCAERVGYHPEIILAGRRINDSIGNIIAHQTVKQMALAGIASVGSNVTVLGLSFKENCPDLRNSRVPDIISELERYGCNVQVHDPLCDKKEALKTYGVSLNNSKSLKPAHALLVAVSHKYYHKWSLEMWQSLLQTGGVILDIKKTIPKKELERAGHLIWNL